MKVEEVVLESHNKLLKERGIDLKSSPDLEIRPRNGIDSLGIVNMILDIEEEFDIELDCYLPKIRQCKTIGNLIDVVKEAINNK